MLLFPYFPDIDPINSAVGMCDLVPTRSMARVLWVPGCYGVGPRTLWCEGGRALGS